MRILIKGGVWKNTEDEILKAAVMKYGLNQWARVSSLIVRKSPKQCKARWYEWLDPSIKKTEWSRDEEEKLLHLAKLMPNQWRTIAPIVGRTAAQCLDHYEKLLDAAQRKENPDAIDPADDPRRLRPGEIDPAPETKPARPDPVDMDEDEKEMLSEARARLENTKGKKAKRKAREKQLEEARRLAALQKRRELKAAGIHFTQKKKNKKQKGIDYNKEVPFFRKAPQGFYDVSKEREEEKRKQKNYNPFARGGKMEGGGIGEVRRDEKEERDRKKDAAKAARRTRTNLPDVIREEMLRAGTDGVKRSKMILANPQIGDEELTQIAKMYDRDTMDEDEDDGKGITRSLLTEMPETPGGRGGGGGGFKIPGMGGSMRTPRAGEGTSTGGSRGDYIMMEAQNLLAMTQTDTPLAGAMNVPLHETTGPGHTTATPNPFLTPKIKSLTGKRPSSIRQVQGSRTPVRTPVIRDSLNINNVDAEDDMPDDEFERQRHLQMSAQVKMALGGLPVPKNDYAIQMPNLDDDDDVVIDVKMDQDKADVIDLLKRLEKKKEERKFSLRSSVLKQNLPRAFSFYPSSSSTSSTSDFDEFKGSEVEDETIISWVNHEMARIVAWDATHYPSVDISKNNKQKGKENDFINLFNFESEMDNSDINNARSLLFKEMEKCAGRDGLSLAQITDIYLNSWNQEYEALQTSLYSSKGVSSSFDSLSKKDQLDWLQKRYETLYDAYTVQNGKVSALETKANTYHAGYLARADSVRSKHLKDSFDSLQRNQQERNCFEAVAAQEIVGGERRVAKRKMDVVIMEDTERELQMRYANLVALQGH